MNKQENLIPGTARTTGQASIGEQFRDKLENLVTQFQAPWRVAFSFWRTGEKDVEELAAVVVELGESLS